MFALIKEKKLLIRRLFIVILDICSATVASCFALLIRFDFNIDIVDERFVDTIWNYMLINIITVLIVFYIFHLYHSIWRFVGVLELENIIIACTVVGIIQTIGLTLLEHPVPRSYYFLYTGFLVALTTLTRFAYRAIRLSLRKRREGQAEENVMVIGAGEAANVIIKEIKTSHHMSKSVKCIIDDDPDKIGRYIHGIKVVGNRDTILLNVEKFGITEITIAMPSSSKKAISLIANICKETGCILKILPGIYQLMNGDVSTAQLRNVEVEDLLGRESIKVDIGLNMSYVTDRVVLVTGGGGSIGSELCRQLAAHHPKQLVIVDIYENNAYAIQQELKNKYPELNLVTLIASVRNTKRINQIFETYRPNIVYHAAAHKHVPLMEDSPNEAVKNNVFGTLKTVIAADKYQVDKFVMISTDKAVNPTNIMGATKRICEMIVQTFNNRSKTEFVAVRFGNVLGSNGSVIPLFKKQIEDGGPVTVTHPDIIRYFMTIPEAVSLVLQAGAYAKGGEIFVLDMGEPVKILDLANNLIRLSGYVPNDEIAVTFTGLRPGEKLYEELLMKEEGMQDTDNSLIHIGKPIAIDEDKFLQQLDSLYEIVKEEPENIRTYVQEIVDTYTFKSYNPGKER
jgi:FlaA1/EpsC-like NDP-sugar epimerase